MQQRWGIKLSVKGDLRFLSHRETMRIIERVAARSRLPVQFTQGFNPHPILSAPCAKPTGVAAQDELMVTRFEDARDLPKKRELLKRMNETAPPGLRFSQVEPLPPGFLLHPVRVDYETSLSKDNADKIAARIDQLALREAWLIKRRIPVKRGKRRSERIIDLNLKPMVADLRLSGCVLRWACVPCDNRWARPGEVLALVGLHEREDLALTVQKSVHYGSPGQGADKAP